MRSKALGRIMAALLCMGSIAAVMPQVTEARVSSEEAGHEIALEQLPGTMSEEKPYDSSFLSVPGYVADGVGDRSEYYDEYVEHNRVQKEAFMAGGGKEENYVNQNTSRYVVVHDEKEFCQAVRNSSVKVIELAADVNLGYKYLQSLGIQLGGVVDKANDYNKNNIPVTSPDIIRDGQSKINLANKDGLTIFSRNGSTIYIVRLLCSTATIS